jgi:hypothetical protein
MENNEKLENQYYHLVDDYYVSTDGTRNIKLSIRKTATKPDSKNYGKLYSVEETYYGNLQSLYKALATKIELSKLDLLFTRNVERVNETLKIAEKNLINASEQMVKEIQKYSKIAVKV